MIVGLRSTLYKRLSKPKRPVELAMSDYIMVRHAYHDVVRTLVHDYMTTPGKDYRSYQSKMKKATVVAYVAASKSVNGNGKSPWLTAKIALVLIFVVKFWEDLWQVKQGREQTAQAAAEAETIALTHAENYARGLDGVWSEAMVRSAGDLPLLFDGIDGRPPEFPCVTCDTLKGQTHPASWWTKRGLIPFQGNTKYACGCWGCKHGLFDPHGIQYTL
jgi:hypothetical protein